MTNPVAFYELAALTPAGRQALLTRSEADLAPFLDKVKPIIERVRLEGDVAIAALAESIDKVPLDPAHLMATEAEFDAAFAELEPEMLETLRYSADNIRRFHEAQMPPEMWMKEIRPGVLVGERATPIDSVACYAPRGKGSFPSVTLMTTIPASVAKVPVAILLTPPGPDGRIDAATLVAARLGGVEKVYRAGGAVGVAAAAFGTASIPRCAKIVGPGSPFVVAAKRLLSDRIDTGLPAGPSESLILADETSNGDLAALDLIIESEHGPDSSAFLVTWSREVAEAARAAIPTYWAQMGELRIGFSSTVLGGPHGGIVLTKTREEAYAFINDYAPEHLQILSKAPLEHLSKIRNAGEILLGEYAAGSIANYMMGPNCVLPTSGWAKSHSALGVRDYLKFSTIGQMTRSGFDEMAPHTHRFATYEGFDAHANAVSGLRLAALREN
jgi:histidinol dehydrogenase